MSKKIEVELDEVKQLYSCLEELNEFFHQPANYRDRERLEKFLSNGGYEKIRTLYYDIVWQWLPDEVQREIEETEPVLTGN